MIHQPLAAFERWLESFLNFERTPKKNILWLDTMQYLCSLLNNPQDCCRSFHIAGSKGKGSVAVMISSILEEAGIPCGLYTSPHIIDFSERITRSRMPFPDAVYRKAAEKVISAVNAISPDSLPENRKTTWFELVTLAAFMVFKEAGMRWAVYETGLGGRLDATNVITPEISVITTIELEHTEFLGNTIEKIAAEKAGIIKAGVPACIEPQLPAARAVFEKTAAKMHSSAVFIDDILASHSSRYVQDGMEIRLDFKNGFSKPIAAVLKMRGDFQLYNAAAAAWAAKSVLPKISEEEIGRGLSKAVLPGRFEIITQPQYIIFDGAHTVNSVASVLKTLRDIKYRNDKNYELLFACAADKDMHGIAELFFSGFCSFSHITVTCPGALKSADFSALTDIFSRFGKKHRITIHADRDYQAAIPYALEQAAKNGSTLLVTGSFYLVAETKKISAAMHTAKNTAEYPAT
ncbi:MAG: bifunctional folylpolyglutamate synthase/dihydrofolate synthase [Bacteroides sp.]|nr:bifunctional folylpolyglutamate synthase/dihydrofolate synthase [Prevotella sp.]MCM1407263.1 bifunctional folylpolyglutamate synthase/dihydrofolate synthase [Treponema brennaborense]MCM1469751.1 bifunctional folylpolyglutamate synthase/dihydrofolate synthase [Bacteroides sp.]